VRARERKDWCEAREQGKRTHDIHYSLPVVTYLFRLGVVSVFFRGAVASGIISDVVRAVGAIRSELGEKTRAIEVVDTVQAVDQDELIRRYVGVRDRRLPLPIDVVDVGKTHGTLRRNMELLERRQVAVTAVARKQGGEYISTIGILKQTRRRTITVHSDH